MSFYFLLSLCRAADNSLFFLRQSLHMFVCEKYSKWICLCCTSTYMYDIHIYMHTYIWSHTYMLLPWSEVNACTNLLQLSALKQNSLTFSFFSKNLQKANWRTLERLSSAFDSCYLLPVCQPPVCRFACSGKWSTNAPQMKSDTFRFQVICGR